MLLTTLFLYTSLLISEEKGLIKEGVLNDMAFQQVWSHLENKDISKEYVLNTFQNTAIKTHSKIIDSFNNPYEKKGWKQYRKIFITEKNFILSNNNENIIPKVVRIAIKDETKSKPFKIFSTSSLALLLFLIFSNEKITEAIIVTKIRTILELVKIFKNFEYDIALSFKIVSISPK